MAPETDLDRFLAGLDIRCSSSPSRRKRNLHRRRALGAWSVTQCSIDPPRLLVCITKINHSYRLASGAQTMGVHVVGSDQRGLAGLFGGEPGDDIDKFAACAWRADPRGVPVLTDCPRRMTADVLDRVDLGDHVGFGTDRGPRSG